MTINNLWGGRLGWFLFGRWRDRGDFFGGLLHRRGHFRWILDCGLVLRGHLDDINLHWWRHLLLYRFEWFSTQGLFEGGSLLCTGSCVWHGHVPRCVGHRAWQAWNRRHNHLRQKESNLLPPYCLNPCNQTILKHLFTMCAYFVSRCTVESSLFIMGWSSCISLVTLTHKFSSPRRFNRVMNCLALLCKKPITQEPAKLWQSTNIGPHQ